MNFAADGEKEMAGWKQADAKAVTWERGCGGKGRKLCHRLKTSIYLRSKIHQKLRISKIKIMNVLISLHFKGIKYATNTPKNAKGGYTITFALV